MPRIGNKYVANVPEAVSMLLEKYESLSEATKLYKHKIGSKLILITNFADPIELSDLPSPDKIISAYYEISGSMYPVISPILYDTVNEEINLFTVDYDGTGVGVAAEGYTGTDTVERI